MEVARLDPLRKPGYVGVRWLFLRLLGAIYLAAFLSLGVQILGLVGSRGILPLAAYLDWVRNEAGGERYWLLPTLFWMGANDAALRLACGGGALLSILLVAGIAPAPLLLVLWALYLSLAVAGRVFLAYQWDSLLLETGFLAVFFAPLGLRPRPPREAQPSAIVLGLLRWLLFRLMFSSGVVKLRSGDAAWRSLTALRYHYWTQPLPTWIGWYMHHLPDWFQTASVALMFVVELFVPFLVFCPRRGRLAACGALVGLQVLIGLSGNYAFFNLLAVALCLPLLDDDALPRRLRELIAGAARGGGEPGEAPPRQGWPSWVLAPVAAVVLLVSAVQMSLTVGIPIPWPQPAVLVYSAVSPFRTIDSYGLFAVMTTSRPEIVVEGSRDGQTWIPYEFRWKPGDLRRAPAFVAPHQPRLDWQMWFAALSSCAENTWFVAFLERLLDGSPPVVALLERNPFPEAPPRFVRAVLYQYRLTGVRTRFREGAWWSREMAGLYCPVLPLGAAPALSAGAGRSSPTRVRPASGEALAGS